jgi:hypothetical protein
VHNHHQHNGPNDRDDQLTYEAKLCEIEQVEEANDKVGPHCPKNANNQIPYQAKAPTAEGPTGQGRGERARDHLQRQVAKGHRK